MFNLVIEWKPWHGSRESCCDVFNSTNVFQFEPVLQKRHNMCSFLSYLYFDISARKLSGQFWKSCHKTNHQFSQKKAIFSTRIHYKQRDRMPTWRYCIYPYFQQRHSVLDTASYKYISSCHGCRRVQYGKRAVDWCWINFWRFSFMGVRDFCEEKV